MAAEKKVDEDWKKQAQEEKKKEAGGEEQPQDRPRSAMPPQADFAHFVTGLAVQATVALAGVEEQNIPPDLAQAKYLIDVLDILKKKTEGNLERDEDALMQELLYKLHMAYAGAIKELNEAGGAGN